MLLQEPQQLTNVMTTDHLTHRQCLKNKLKNYQEDMEPQLVADTRRCHQPHRKKCRENDVHRQSDPVIPIERELIVVMGRLTNTKVDVIGKGSEHLHLMEVGVNIEIEEEDPGDYCQVNAQE